MAKKAFEAVYENGVLRPLSSLPLVEGERVRISFEKEEVALEKELLQKLAMAAEAMDPQIPGPIEAYETARQLQEFLEKTKEEAQTNEFLLFSWGFAFCGHHTDVRGYEHNKARFGRLR